MRRPTLSEPDDRQSRGAARSVAVVGSGRMGSGLVSLLAPHTDVVWASRDPARLAQRLDALEMGGRVRPEAEPEALEADVVVLALWHDDAVAFATRHARRLAGTVVVDIANPFTPDFLGFSLPETTSAAERLAAAAPAAHVVGAFKNTFWVVLEEPTIFPEGPSDVLVTGDDAASKELVLATLAPLPFRFLDAGPLANSRTVERMTLLGRELAQRTGSYPRTGWRLLGVDGR
ncbi:hypothetical protein SAMN04515665_12827 [Blastococcus sp. DSM 46786]|uniref:NADPH-dependent F420 reductase n=1 Tax=Blastococcus sp. DSM 46786 TaxID=1798227 RepID=UPI0008C7CA93|nr:NAD(P)-binding domain-containing protein [Blastococcus sp. DSM 46786]SEM05966.1 hypothetical protein SAMN04515665_12827 [Blastococcus sp. DSM 46786]